MIEMTPREAMIELAYNAWLFPDSMRRKPGELYEMMGKRRYGDLLSGLKSDDIREVRWPWFDSVGGLRRRGPVRLCYV